MIPYAKTYTATVSGEVLKFVQCENCNGEFAYRMARQATGSGTSMLFLDNQGASDRASGQAQEALVKLLESECDPVPCPDCGWYQKHMHSEIRAGHHIWMFALGIILVFIDFFAAIIVFTTNAGLRPHEADTLSLIWAGVIFAGILGLGLIIARKVMASSYDPNMTDVEQRKILGQQLAMRKADLDKLIEEQQKSEAANRSEAEVDNN